jgi:hypothetical protein
MEYQTHTWLGLHNSTYRCSADEEASAQEKFSNLQSFLLVLLLLSFTTRCLSLQGNMVQGSQQRQKGHRMSVLQMSLSKCLVTAHWSSDEVHEHGLGLAFALLSVCLSQWSSRWSLSYTHVHSGALHLWFSLCWYLSPSITLLQLCFYLSFCLSFNPLPLSPWSHSQSLVWAPHSSALMAPLTFSHHQITGFLWIHLKLIPPHKLNEDREQICPVDHCMLSLSFCPVE